MSLSEMDLSLHGQFAVMYCAFVLVKMISLLQLDCAACKRLLL